jgi:hypothetical protein
MEKIEDWNAADSIVQFYSKAKRKNDAIIYQPSCCKYAETLDFDQKKE